MSHRVSIRRATVSALVAGAVLAALVPAMVGAATPRAGYYYNGNTLHADQTPGTVSFKVFRYGCFSGTVRKVLSVSATTQLKCATGEVKEDRYLVCIIMGGQINKYGKFRYTGNGFSIRGRFTTRTSARGTLSRTIGDCKGRERELDRQAEHRRPADSVLTAENQHRAMQPRVAGHTERLNDAVRFYRDGLGLTEIGGLRNHDGDDVFLAVPRTSAHLADRGRWARRSHTPP